LPGAILVFSLLFLLLSYLRYESSMVAMMRRLNHGSEQVEASTLESQDEGGASDLTESKESTSKTDIKKREKAMTSARKDLE